MAFGLAILIGVPAGVVAALKHNTWMDYSAIFYSTIGWAIPIFIVGPVLILAFSLRLKWFPTSRWEGPEYWVLPTITLGTALSAYFARLTRGSMLETLQQDFVRTAQAKGLPYRTVVMKHVLRNSLIPVVTQAGPLLGFVITGSFLTEWIFSIPGLGRTYISSVSNRDYSVVMGLAVLLSSVIILANLVVDIIYGILDPRIRYE
ncbi:MAG: ABC transporter permease [Thermoleophilia bacterium]|nr:ABC transporter permease [Thermoleophilia bacterium]